MENPLSDWLLLLVMRANHFDAQTSLVTAPRKNPLYKCSGTYLQHPYPTEDENQDLIRQTDSQTNQISNWVINGRGRHLTEP